MESFHRNGNFSSPWIVSLHVLQNSIAEYWSFLREFPFPNTRLLLCLRALFNHWKMLTVKSHEQAAVSLNILERCPDCVIRSFEQFYVGLYILIDSSSCGAV